MNSKANGGIAFISTDIDRDIYINETQKYCRCWGDANVSISDCSRVISLAFNGYDKADKANSLQKIRKIIRVLQNFEELLINEYKYQDNLKAQYPAKREYIKRNLD